MTTQKSLVTSLNRLRNDPTKMLYVSWGALGVAIVAFSAWLTYHSAQFGYDTAVIDMPILSLLVGLLAMGLAYLALLPPLVRQTEKSITSDNRKKLLLVVIGAGLLARLILFASEPMLEDDYQRYLWDGAVTAHGLNPYKATLDSVADGTAGPERSALKDQSGLVFERISYRHLSTIYPPIAQGAFAAAYLIKPWSLTAWRIVVLAVELSILGLLIILLRDSGRPTLWSALYWWNPLVLKEIANSSHMDALVVVFILLAIFFAVRAKHLFAVTALAFAVGAKLWPAVLLPIFLRSLWGQWRKLAICVAAFTAINVVWLIPILSGRLDSSAGFVAYTAGWQLNSPLFSIIETALRQVLSFAIEPARLVSSANITSKIVVALVVSGIALMFARMPATQITDLATRVMFTSASLVFLTPAAYPWYVVWFLPFLAFQPHIGLLALTPAMALYYLRFYFLSRGDTETFDTVIAWLIWSPVWALCLYSAWQSFKERNKKDANTV